MPDLLKKNRGVAPYLPFFLPALALAIVLISAGLGYGAVQEQQDRFCASCHSQPEVTFYQRSLGAAPVDLASDHATKNVRCIACHDGVGLLGHLQAVTIGARNAFLFYTGLAVQPARLREPIPDSACLKCHESDVLRLERNNHQHFLLTNWQAVDPHAGGCVSCHSAHTTDGPALHGFLNMARSQTVCDACHRMYRDKK